MNLITILNNVHNKDYWRSKTVVCFLGKDYPYYFLQKLFLYLEQQEIFAQPRTKNGLALQQPFDIKAAINTLQQTMLGLSYVYWLGDINLLCSGKQRDLLLNFLVHYKGPNQLLFFVDVEPKIAKDCIIEMPSVIKQQEMRALYQWYAQADELGALKHPKKKEFVEYMINRHQSFSLDAGCMLIEYVATMSVRTLEELALYLEKTIASSSSLTVLVDAFFARNAKKFFEEWRLVESEYPPVFWLIYWSDYLWRAYNVVTFLKNNQLLDAKKAGYKMPYSFMSHGWRQYSLEYLAERYKELYAIDFGLKQGVQGPCFELFFLNHFNSL